MKTVILTLLVTTLTVFNLLYILDPLFTLHIKIPILTGRTSYQDAVRESQRIGELRPSLFAKTANAEIGNIAITAAEAELRKPEPNFSAAHYWLNTLLNRQGPATGCEAKAGHLLQEMPARHFSIAHELFEKKELERALVEYEKIERLYPKDSILARSTPERCMAEIEATKKLAEAGDSETALDHLAKLPLAAHLPPGMVVKALDDVPKHAEKAIQARIGRGDFDGAFKLMESLNARFPEPEVQAGLRDLRARIDLELFNVALDNPQRSRKASGVETGDFDVTDDEKTILKIKNETHYPMKLVYVGPQRLEVELPANGSKEVKLVPGRYLAGVCWPAHRTLRSQRSQVIFRAGETIQKLFYPAEQSEVY